MGGADAERYLKTEFLERIAHELRGPAGVTLGALDELGLALGAESARVANLIAMARRSVQRVLRTAERLQRTAQLESGDVEWQHERRDLRDIVRAAVLQVEGIEARKGVAVVLALSDEPCVAEVDVGWVTAAITELLLNAIRNAKTTAEVSTSRANGEVRVTLRDDGSGFSAPLNARFTPTGRRQGLGLSMSLVGDVAAAHSGKLVVDDMPASEGNKGARVHLVFPERSAEG